MGIRFRKSFKLAPGVRLNLGKRGGSIGFGRKGFGLTAGTSGTWVRGSLRGTGLSASAKLGASRRSASGRRGEDADVHDVQDGPAWLEQDARSVWIVVALLAMAVVSILSHM